MRWANTRARHWVFRYLALYQPFIEVLQPLVKPDFPALEGLKLSLRLFAVKPPLLLPCLQKPVYADGVLSVGLYRRASAAMRSSAR